MINNDADLSILEMSPEEQKKLPKRLRKSLIGAQPAFVIGSSSPREAKLIAKVAKTAAKIAREHRKAMTEDRVETLVDLYLEGEPLAQVDEDLERDNAALRARYLKQVPCLSAVEIRAMLSNPPRNPSEPTSRWKREGRVFAVPHGKGDRFPAFQFDHGRPLAVIRKTLLALPEDMSPWQTALWFYSGNGWLDGASPQESLSDPDAVANAARQLSNPAVG